VSAPVEIPNIESKENCYTIINTSNNDMFAIEAGGDRVIIEEDRMKLGYECKTCEGDGYIDKTCDYCKGEKYTIGIGPSNTEEKIPCRFCVQPERGLTGGHRGMGKETCPDCKGKGALVVIPQTSERRPTSGTIRSKGPDVSKCKECGGTGLHYIEGVVTQHNVQMSSVGSQITPVLVKCLKCKGEGVVGLKLNNGDRVIYPIFAGTAIEFKQKGTCRIMHENEIMGKIYGIGRLGDHVK
jgi:co-chaperonin GroES (HSP10)